jgi:N-acetylglutamate synthase-like GNAT family acetyltransferase
MNQVRVQHKELPFIISTDVEDIEFDRVFLWLSKEAYWSEGIPMSVLRTAFENSIVFGLYHEKQGQIGVARMITDKATFAYLADVFIDESFRGKGLAKWLMETIMSHTDLQGLRRIMLATSDMQGLYKKFGFSDVGEDNLLMEIAKPDIYKGMYR